MSVKSKIVNMSKLNLDIFFLFFVFVVKKNIFKVTIVS